MDVSNGIDTPRRGSAAEQTPVRQDSYFDGNTWQYIGYHLLSFLVCTLTLGIAYPWMLCMIRRWEVKHTVIHGRRLRFDGIEEEYTISQIDGQLYLGGENGLVKASPIVGTWGTAVMDSCDTEYDGVVVSESTLETFCLTMEPDGLFSCMDRYYVWINDYNNEYDIYAPAEGTNWGIPAMGFPTVYGTYELRDTELVLHLLWDDVGNEYDDYTTFQFLLQPDGTLLLDGWQYYQGCDTLADLCGRFGYPTN